MAEIGKSIEEFKVEGELGRGGFAVVYKGRCKNTGKEVAIKMIDIRKITYGGLINRVRQEVTIHSQLNHPVILKLFTFFEDQQYVYLILELCPNGELQKHIKSLGRVLSEDEARDYLSQIVSGMIYLHSQNIMHRDLTLSNLLLDKNWRIKIADFGLATQLQRPDDRHTTMCGTPNYISPEVATRSSHGLESDVWSLGCMLFIMLVGHPPFNGKDARASMTNAVIGNYKIPSYVSASASSLISDCLQKDPRKRIKLEMIPKHLFMMAGTKGGISRMSDSGMFTMSTVTSTNNTRLPLSVISESNVSGYENLENYGQHSARSTNEAVWKHPSSPPVRMKTSPRKLLPPNAGVIDSLKRAFTPLPDVPLVQPSARRERDISEERRKVLPIHHRDGSTSSNDRSDSSQMSDDTPRLPRRGFHRGHSEQNLRSDVHIEKGYGNVRRQRSLDRDCYTRSEGVRSAEYRHGYDHEEVKQLIGEFHSDNRSLDKNYKVSIPHRREQEVGYMNDTRSRSRENSCHRQNDDHCGSYQRSRSEERSRNFSPNCFEEYAHGKHRDRDTLKKSQRRNSLDRYRDPSSDSYEGKTLNRGILREPEHRSRQEPLDHHENALVLSCCQETSQHRSHCDKRIHRGSKEKDTFHSFGHSGVGQNSQPFAPITSNSKNIHRPKTHGWVDTKEGDSSTPQGHNDRILRGIPPVKNCVQDSVEKENSSVSYRDQGKSQKIYKSCQSLQEKVSPISSKRVEARRNRCKDDVIMNVLDDGEVCMEYLSCKKGKEKVVEVCRISSDGMRIVLYQPNRGAGCISGDSPPPLPEEGADHIFSFENLPRKYWKRYIRAARFVDILKANTPKVTYKCKEFQAKGTLMENSDFEVVFDSGLKMIIRGSNLVVKSKEGSVITTIPKSSAPAALPDEFHSFYMNFKEIHDDCLESEKFYTELMEKKGRDFFPVRMNPTCPGLSTPPVSARGNSQLTEDKENVPLSVQQSFRSSRRPADRQLGSFQKSETSIRSVTSCKHPSTHHTSVNPEEEMPIILSNPGPQIDVPNIGWATKGDNGVALIRFYDGTEVMLSSALPVVVFTDESKVTKTYSTHDKLPEMLGQKLKYQIPVVLNYLDRPSNLAGTSATSHRVGIR